jgi:hypothetical protein
LVRAKATGALLTASVSGEHAVRANGESAKVRLEAGRPYRMSFT